MREACNQLIGLYSFLTSNFVIPYLLLLEFLPIKQFDEHVWLVCNLGVASLCVSDLLLLSWRCKNYFMKIISVYIHMSFRSLLAPKSNRFNPNE